MPRSNGIVIGFERHRALLPADSFTARRLQAMAEGA
jgi:hypothetical protein